MANPKGTQKNAKNSNRYGPECTKTGRFIKTIKMSTNIQKPFKNSQNKSKYIERNEHMFRNTKNPRKIIVKKKVQKFTKVVKSG